MRSTTRAAAAFSLAFALGAPIGLAQVSLQSPEAR